jgi:transcriptional regulator with XRE-family HTH domain
MKKQKTLEDRDPLLQAMALKIRTLRESREISQEEFAYEADINRSYYGFIERGKYSPTAVILAKIAVTLDVEIGELFPTKQELRELLKAKKDNI